jgi:hypothetical protein
MMEKMKAELDQAKENEKKQKKDKRIDQPG